MKGAAQNGATPRILRAPDFGGPENPRRRFAMPRREGCSGAETVHWSEPPRYHPELQERFYVKDLKKVRRLGYQLERSLVVDDSPEKVRCSYGVGRH